MENIQRLDTQDETKYRHTISALLMLGYKEVDVQHSPGEFSKMKPLNIRGTRKTRFELIWINDGNKFQYTI